MDFSFTKQEELFLQMIREFAEKEVKPLAAEVDEEERFPMETVQKMAKIGLMGIPVPKQYGGAGGTNIMYGMAVEELSRVCATTGVILSAHTSLCCAPILEAGTEEQKMKYLQKCADMYLFPTDVLARKINIDSKLQAIVYGAYEFDGGAAKRRVSDGKIRVAYTGSFDPNKGGLSNALGAAMMWSPGKKISITRLTAAIPLESAKASIPPSSWQTIFSTCSLVGF